jgi:hypothetical protein
MKYLIIILATLLYSCTNQSQSLFIKGKDILTTQGYTNIVQTNTESTLCKDRVNTGFTAINKNVIIQGCFCGVGDEVIINFY